MQKPPLPTWIRTSFIATVLPHWPRQLIVADHGSVLGVWHSRSACSCLGAVCTEKAPAHSAASCASFSACGAVRPGWVGACSPHASFRAPRPVSVRHRAHSSAPSCSEPPECQEGDKLQGSSVCSRGRGQVLPAEPEAAPQRRHVQAGPHVPLSLCPSTIPELGRTPVIFGFSNADPSSL